MTVAGAANGAFTLAEALRQGHEAGGGEGASPNAPAGNYSIQASWPKADDEGRRWIDFQNDVTLKDVALAAREGYVSVEHLKRYTTLGMATDQGKTANVNAIAAMAALTGRTIDETGTTTYRPPFVPTPMGVIAGRRRGALLNPLRRLPLEAEHRAEGAQMREYGGWLRPAWYGPDDPERAIQREAARARDSVALFDGSSLGKIEIIGPDAAALADFNSYNRLSTLKPGRIRYGFLLQESGVVFDDGVTLRLGEDRFLVSCSSGHTDAVRMRLELWRQDRFDPARVAIHDTTAQWATLTITGPRSRDLIEACGLDVALDDQSLPHMAFATAEFDGAPLRAARVSFTGDRSYELSVPARRAGAFARAPRRQAAGVRRRAAGPRGADGPAGGERVHRRRQGHRRDDHAARPRRDGPARLEGGRIYRQALAVHARRQRPAPQAIGGPERAIRRSAAADRRACHSGRGPSAAIARLRDVELFQSEPGPPSRAWPRRRLDCPAWAKRSASTISAPSGERPSQTRSRSIRKESGSMREMEWPPARGGAELLVDRPRLTARRLDGLGQTLISGDLERGRRLPRAGRADPRPLCAAPAGAHALRIGRTSALLITPAPLSVVDGWRDGWCATCVDDGWAAVEVSGADAPGALMQATSADLASASPSAAVMIFGLRGLLARTPSGFRVHVEAPWLETLLGWLDGV